MIIDVNRAALLCHRPTMNHWWLTEITKRGRFKSRCLFFPNWIRIFIFFWKKKWNHALPVATGISTNPEIPCNSNNNEKGINSNWLNSDRLIQLNIRSSLMSSFAYLVIHSADSVFGAWWLPIGGGLGEWRRHWQPIAVAADRKWQYANERSDSLPYWLTACLCCRPSHLIGRGRIKRSNKKKNFFFKEVSNAR